MEEPEKSHRKDKILITGGLGFIFSHVTEYFVKNGWDVVVIDNESEGSHPEIIDGSFKYYKFNVADEKVIDFILEEKPDYIIHAAAISDVDYSIREPHKVLLENTLATFNVFDACQKLPNLKKFLYVSTDEVYGECESLKDEGDLVAPRNPYSASKAIGSLLRIAYDNTYANLSEKTVETRFCNVFGERQDTRKIMPIIKRSIKTGEAVPVFDEGGSYREYIHVSNIPPAVDLILQNGIGVYNVTSNDGYRVKDLVKKAEEVTGCSIATVVSHRPGVDMKYQMSNNRINELGWENVISFEEGLKNYLLS